MNSTSLCGLAAMLLISGLTSCVGYDPYAYGGSQGYSRSYYAEGYRPIPALGPRSSSVAISYIQTGSTHGRPYGYSNPGNWNSRTPAYCPPAASFGHERHSSGGNRPPQYSGASASSSFGHRERSLSGPPPTMGGYAGLGRAQASADRGRASSASSGFPMVRADGSEQHHGHGSSGSSAGTMDRLRERGRRE